MPSARTLTEAGIRLYQEGRLVEAVAAYAAALEQAPEDPDALQLAGLALGKLGRSDQAIRHFRRSITLRPEFFGAYHNLGNLLRGRDDPAAAAAFARAARCAPELVEARQALVDIARGIGKPRLAIQACEELLALSGPHGALYATLIALCLDERLFGKAVDFCRQAFDTLAHDPAAREGVLGCYSLILNSVVPDDGLLERAHALALELLADDPKSVLAVYLTAYRPYAEGRMLEAAAIGRRLLANFDLDEIKQENMLRLWYLCRCDAAFFDAIAAHDLDAALPPATFVMKSSAPAPGPVLYFGCDGRYFSLFGVRLIESIALCGPGQTVHAHVVNPSPETMAHLFALQRRTDVTVNFSVERTSDPDLDERFRRPDRMRTYHACVRFARLPEILRRYGGTIVNIDVDCVVTDDVRSLLTNFPDADVLVLNEGMRSAPTRDYNASFFVVHDGPEVRLYCGLVARYIMNYYLRDVPFWMLDQAALFCVHEHLKAVGRAPRFGFVPYRQAARLMHPPYFLTGTLEEKVEELERRFATLKAGVKDKPAATGPLFGAPGAG